jgi:hypothetical protein
MWVAARRPDDQLRAESCLNSADSLRHGSPGELQLRGSAGKGTALRNLGEDGEPFEVRQLAHESESETISFDSFYF